MKINNPSGYRELWTRNEKPTSLLIRISKDALFEIYEDQIWQNYECKLHIRYFEKGKLDRDSNKGSWGLVNGQYTAAACCLCLGKAKYVSRKVADRRLILLVFKQPFALKVFILHKKIKSWCIYMLQFCWFHSAVSGGWCKTSQALAAQRHAEAQAMRSDSVR